MMVQARPRCGISEVPNLTDSFLLDLDLSSRCNWINTNVVLILLILHLLILNIQKKVFGYLNTYFTLIQHWIWLVNTGGWILCARLGGKLRAAMYLQAVYLGESLGNLLCPMIAHPFLSQPAQNTSIVSHGRVHESLNHLVKPKYVNKSLYSLSSLSEIWTIF